MTKGELDKLYKGLDSKQKAEAEIIFQKRRDKLFEWYDAEKEKVYNKLKEEGRYETRGLDANNSQPEVKALSAEYNRRFYALPEESICELLGINAE